MFSTTWQPCLSPDDGFGSGSLGGASPLAYNPLNRQIGDRVTFRDADLSSLQCEVEQVATSKVTVDGEVFYISDYELLAKKTPDTEHLADSDGYVRLKLRCIPTEDNSIETIVFQAQRLDEGANWQFEQLAAQQDSVTLRDSTGAFQHGFTRIDDADQVYRCERTTIGDPTKSGGGASEIEHYSIRSLDYERETSDGAGNEYTQYGIVEFNERTNAMVTLFGWSIDPNDVQ